MSRARNHHQTYQQTATTAQGSGCLSLSWIAMLGVFLIASLMTLLALNTPSPTLARTTTDPIPLSPIFTPEVQYWRDKIIQWANASSLDPNLVAVVMQIESCGDPYALSSAGAIGLFQVMPFHFEAGENPYQPDTNAQRGLNYLARSLESAQGNIRLALAGYNGGIGVISRGEWNWPAETLRYVYFGEPIYQDALGGNEVSPNIQAWHGKYGAGLCRQASRRLGLDQ